MKKAIKMVLVLALAVLCLTAVAAAAEGPASGICDVTVVSDYTSTVTVKAMTVDKTEVTTPTAQDGKQVYADAVRLEVTLSGADANAQYVVLVIKGDELDADTVPTESNVTFIDQNATAVFDIYPSALENDVTYTVYLSSNAASGIQAATKVATFSYYAPYTPGDVNEDGNINTQDAMQCFRHFAKKITLSGNQFLAADVQTDNKVNVQDGMQILRYYAKKITSFE